MAIVNPIVLVSGSNPVLPVHSRMNVQEEQGFDPGSNTIGLTIAGAGLAGLNLPNIFLI